MHPNVVNPGNFTVLKIVYNDPNTTFAVAIGTWYQDGTVRFAIR